MKPAKTKTSLQDLDTTDIKTPDVSAGDVEFALSPEDQIDIDLINKVITDNDLAGGKVRISRKGPTDTQFQYLVTIPVEQFDIEWVKKAHGGGDYKCKTFRTNGQTGKQFSFSIDYRAQPANEGVSGPRQVSYSDPMKNVKELAELVINQNKGGDNTQLIREMMAQSRTDSTNMIAMMSKSQETQMATITAAFASLAQAQASASAAASAQASRSSLPPEVWAAIIAGVSPIVLKLIDKGTPQNNTLETIELIKSIKETFADNSEPKEESMLGSFFKAIGPAFGAMTGMGAPTPRALPVQTPSYARGPVGGPPSPNGAGAGNGPAGGPSSRSANANAPTPAAAKPSPDVAMVNMYVNMLYDAASKDADPAIYAEMLFNHAPEQFVTKLVATLHDDNWSRLLFGDDPRATEYIEWLTELRTVIIENSQPENNEQHNQPTQPMGTKSGTAPTELVEPGHEDNPIGHGTDVGGTDTTGR